MKRRLPSGDRSSGGQPQPMSPSSRQNLPTLNLTHVRTAGLGQALQVSTQSARVVEKKRLEPVAGSLTQRGTKVHDRQPAPPTLASGGRSRGHYAPRRNTNPRSVVNVGGLKPIERRAPAAAAAGAAVQPYFRGRAAGVGSAHRASGVGAGGSAWKATGGAERLRTGGLPASRAGLDGAAAGGHNASAEVKPMTPAQVLKGFLNELTDFEQSEILEYARIYYIGTSESKQRPKVERGAPNNGYDDERGDYIHKVGEHIAYRFEVRGVLGKGSFGQVLRVYDHKTRRERALKIIRNKKRFHHQALIEVKVLEHIRAKDPDDATCLIKCDENLYFRNHLCISFELLSINLFEFIKSNNFQGVSLGLIRRFAVQLLRSLQFLRRQHIIHCDLKPENILLKQVNKSAIKVIDFGSSCFERERVYTYIQSRFYRSPEVMLGLPYGVAIDMWSLACILSELHTGFPLFPGIMEVFGVPPPALVDAATRKKIFFEADGAPRIVANSRGRKRHPGTKTLQGVLKSHDPSFVNFLEQCLRWDPKSRMTPSEALEHPWIRDVAAPAPPSGAVGRVRQRSGADMRYRRGGASVSKIGGKAEASAIRAHHRSGGGGTRGSSQRQVPTLGHHHHYYYSSDSKDGTDGKKAAAGGAPRHPRPSSPPSKRGVGAVQQPNRSKWSLWDPPRSGA